MDQLSLRLPSPYRIFSIEEWAKLRADTPMTLSAEEILALRSLGDPISLEEVVSVYLPISRLLSLYVDTMRGLFDATRRFLGSAETKTPFIIGIAGSVAVGKSTTARLLRELLSRWPSAPKVDLVATDGFLLPNAVLEADGLMERKGFPESYDLSTLLAFLTDIKAGKPCVTAPVYSHMRYDIVPGEVITIDRPDILLLEGLNVLQTQVQPKDGRAIPFVSDFIDFSIYLDADEAALQAWYVERFMHLKENRFRSPASYFHDYASIDAAAAKRIAVGLWTRINRVNLLENILPTRLRADLLLYKDTQHRIRKVALRKL